MRTGLISGAVTPEALMHRIVNELGCSGFSTGYGMTEASPEFYMCEPTDSITKKAMTVGKIMPQTESKIINSETGAIVPWGMPGEVLVRGYLIMKGYWGDAEKTKEAIDSDGWLHTGDLGKLDEDGYLQIIGRSKDMIIRGGENIFPKEIEEFFMQHPAIANI